jgi:ATP-dependent Clp protease ATP-binding subunit ClpB
MEGRIGFAEAQQLSNLDKSQIDLDEKIQRTAVQAASRNFSPEFMNRIDKIVVFHSLNQRHLPPLHARAAQQQTVAAAIRFSQR